MTSRTAHLALWAAQNEPVLGPCPELPAVLLEPKDARLGYTRDALRSVLWEMTERPNTIVPAARELAARHDEDHG